MEYKEVVKLIEGSEKRVDEVLKAARLERHERNPMDYEKFKFICYFFAGMTAMVMGFITVCMLIA